MSPVSNYEHKRFSDDELAMFYREFKEHQQHEVHDREQLMRCMTDNKEAVDRLTAETRDLVKAWKSANVVVDVSAALGKFVKWVVGLGLPIYAIVEFFKHTDKLK